MIGHDSTPTPNTTEEGSHPATARLAASRVLYVEIAAGFRSGVRRFAHWSWQDPTGRGSLAVVAAASVSAVFLGWISIERYWAFQTFAWDLGNYNQGMFTAAFAHRLFFYTADLPSGNPGSLLAAHFAPVLFLVLPFYALEPNPVGLVVIQAIVLAAGVLPLYLLARRVGLPNGWSGLVASAYLLSPVLIGIDWYDFHLEALLPVTVIWAVYCYYSARWWAFAAAWLLALSVIETIGPLLFLFAAAALVGLLAGRYRGVEPAPQVWRRTIFATTSAPAWAGLAVLVTAILGFGHGAFGAAYSAIYRVLGPNLSFVSAVPYAIAHPFAAAAAVQYDVTSKLAYLVVLFGSLAFLPFLGPKRLLLPVAGWAVLVVLSDGASLYSFGDQYAAYPFPFLAAGMAFGLARLRSRWWAVPGPGDAAEVGLRSDAGKRKLRRTLPPGITGPAVILAVVLSTLTVSPLLPQPAYNYTAVSHGFPTVTAHDQALREVVGMIPPAAAVLTVSGVFPEVSSRVHAYVVPISTSFRVGTSFVGVLDGYVNSSVYVLIDYDVDFFGSSVLIGFANLSGFGILAEQDGIVLYEKGWLGSPQLWVPEHRVIAGGDLQTTPYSFPDSTNGTAYGPALTSRPNPPRGALLWTGPYVYDLAPGRYAATFWISLTARTQGPQLRLDTLRSALDIQAVREVSPSGSANYAISFAASPPTIVNLTFLENNSATTYAVTTNATLLFPWGNLGIWGVAGWTYTDFTEVRLYTVTLQQLSP